jgi:hypothetical protein
LEEEEKKRKRKRRQTSRPNALTAGTFSRNEITMQTPPSLESSVSSLGKKSKPTRRRGVKHVFAANFKDENARMMTLLYRAYQRGCVLQIEDASVITEGSRTATGWMGREAPPAVLSQITSAWKSAAENGDKTSIRYLLQGIKEIPFEL